MKKPKMTSKKLLRMIGNPKRLVGELQRSERDEIYLENNCRILVRFYPNQFVAVYDQVVVDSDEDMDKLLARLRKKRINMHRVVIRFMSTKPEPMLFSAAA
jgi:hypothetical protein